MGAKTYVLLNCIFTFLITSSLHGLESENQQSVSRRFLGFLKVEESKAKIPAAIDFIVVQSQDEYAHLRAILTLSLGSHLGHEYTGYYYENVQYNWMTGEYFIQNNTQPMVLFQLKETKDPEQAQTILLGRFINSLSQVEGDLYLIKESSQRWSDSYLKEQIWPELPVLTSLSGQYEGICDEKHRVLQIEAHRFNPGDRDMASHVLPGYRIVGRLGGEGAGLCQSPKRCVEAVFSNGYYDFYRQKFVLHSRQKPLYCRNVSQNEWDCGGCRFQKLATQVDQQKDLADVPFYFGKVDDDEPLPDLPEPQDINGAYRGEVFHVHTGIIQPIEIVVHGMKIADRPHQPHRLMVVGQAFLYFGQELASRSANRYRFYQRPFLATQPYFIFEGDGDLFFQVQSWGKQFISGHVYSRLAGFIGPFRVLKNGVLTQGTMPDIKGAYNSELWQLILENESVIPLPAQFGLMQQERLGVAQLGSISRRYELMGSRYDFYRQHLTLQLSDGRLIGGRVLSHGLRLFWPGKPEWGVMMDDQQWPIFLRQGSN